VKNLLFHPSRKKQLARRTSAWAAAVATIIYISYHHFSMALNFALYLTLLLITYVVLCFLLLKLQKLK